MAKYSGYLGIALPDKEVSPGVWSTEQIEEKKVKGTYMLWSRNYQPADSVNDNLQVTNAVKLNLPAELANRVGSIRYLTINGTPWKVDSISLNEMNARSLILNLGGIWNGQRPEGSTPATSPTNN